MRVTFLTAAAQIVAVEAVPTPWPLTCQLLFPANFGPSRPRGRRAAPWHPPCFTASSNRRGSRWGIRTD